MKNDAIYCIALLFACAVAECNALRHHTNSFLFNKKIDDLIKCPADRVVYHEILSNIWTNDNPMFYAQDRYVDEGYPHISLGPNEEIVTKIIDASPTNFWLEVGSMVGGSAISTAEILARKAPNASIVCIDAFTGDVNMLAWEKPFKEEGKWLFVRNEHGRCTIYDRFKANVVEAGYGCNIVPIQASGLVGMKLLRRLFDEKRLSLLPGVIFLDSAHELGETLLELTTAWSLLPSGGVLFGDDWTWDAVAHDVTEFARKMHANGELNTLKATQLVHQVTGSKLLNESFLVTHRFWALIKK